MAISKKVLIRVIGAPILLSILGGIFAIDYVMFDPEGTGAPLIGTRCLIAVIGALCLVEFYGMCRMKGIETASIAGVVFLVIALAPLSWFMKTIGLPGISLRLIGSKEVVLFVLVIYTLCLLVFRHGRFTVEGAALTIGGYLYVVMLGLAVAGPPKGLTGWYFILFLVAANKGSDMAAYVVGKAIGRHKMTPELSPNKTWEGAVAGAVVGAGSAAAIFWFSPLHVEYPNAGIATLLLFSLSVTIAAQVGDLVESAIKRWAGAKDSGRLIPEFGGFLDMADSFLVSVPVAFLLRVWVLE